MPPFFGLSEEYKKHIYEEFFVLTYHGNWSFREAYNLPVLMRRWFVNKIVEQKNAENPQQ